jgi:uncharacterized protein YcnI
LRIARIAAAFVLASGLSAGMADAHVELAAQSAVAGSDFTAVFRVEHGCGNDATTAMRIRLDDRIVSVTPVAKPGWTAQVTQASANPTGGAAPGARREVSWTGGTIPAHSPGEFQMRVKLPDAPLGAVIYFPVVQECGSATVRWIETPLPGESLESLDHPAPFVTLTNGPTSPGNAR